MFARRLQSALGRAWRLQRPWARLAVLVAAAWPQITFGAEPAAEQAFAEQLASGEFAPALAAAKGLSDAGQRDDWLVRLSEAQARGGGSGAFTTLAQVADDRTRSTAAQSAREILQSGSNRGGSQADFDTLMDLITNTVKPQSWDEVGGPGTISPFNNGVYVDASGELKRALRGEAARGLAVERLASLVAAENKNPRQSVPLRKVSLPRLEKHVQLALAAGRRPDDEMLNLAGLERIKYMLVFPETGDLVLAGPAGPWRLDDGGRAVSVDSGRPVVQLDDLVVVLRFLSATPQGTFGCSIDPTAEGLARTKAFVAQSSASPLKPGQRGGWLKDLRNQMGRQSISVEGLDPRTHAARVLVEADYHMKLVGMGLEPGTLEVPSYLALVNLPRGQSPPPMEVLRWWFTLKYEAVRATSDRNAFELRGSGVQVLSENELLNHLGRRVHTGKSDPLNQEFADRFTRNFDLLAKKYPVYAELQNVFDLALVSALIHAERLSERVDWHMTCFGDAAQYREALGPAPRSVETVINHRVVNDRHIIAGVSGGVHVSPWPLTRPGAIHVDGYGALDAQRKNSAAGELPLEAWWWD
jgi:hypothetical protein